MKRDTLYRGKRLDTKEWIYGDLITNSIIDPFTYIAIGVGYKVDDLELGKAIKVYPHTVGEFIGEYDEEKKPIFEEDICYDSVNEENIIIEYKDGFFGGRSIKDNSFGGVFFKDEDGNNLLIKKGNIHDNPELLENEK